MSEKRLLLHICCAPDATVPWEALIEEGYETVGFFYGGNVHPAREYEMRRMAVAKLAEHIGGFCHYMPYEPDEWLSAVKGFEDEPERGRRCALCFELQTEEAARFAAGNGFAFLSTTLTISPHKDAKLINEIGAKAAKKYSVEWVEKIWRKNDGFKRSVKRSKELGLYRQNYCGCIFSKRSAFKNFSTQRETRR